MKFSALRFFVILFFTWLFAACSKEKCEIWEYTRDCEEHISGACNGWNPSTKLWAYLCGDQLNGIHAGAAVVSSDDAERKVTRHYIRKVE